MKSSLIALIVGVVVIIGGFVYYFRDLYITSSGNQTQGTTNTGTNGLPTVPDGGTVTTDQTAPPENTFSSAAEVGSPVMTKNFKNDPQTIVDSNNKGYYYLSGGLNPTATHAPYSTFYNDTDQSYNVTLLAEPLSQYRKAAETELMQKLGINEVAMCRLRYSVNVPYWVDENYAGVNLGWSFCPGATQLP